MKSIFWFLLILLSVGGLAKNANAQNDTSKPVKVAVFIPLYADAALDSVHSDTENVNLPRNTIAGLEFYNGVMLAIDSLNLDRAKVDISIYDTKRKGQQLSELMKRPELAGVGLMIAVITNTAELKIFADQALARSVPLISATYPNYVGVFQNPYFVLLNSSFKTHLDGLFAHMQKYYSASSIIALTKKGGTEDYIKNYINALNKNRTPLKIKWVYIDANKVGEANLIPSLDSTKNNVVFVASPQENFGLEVVEKLSSYENYPITAIGMPTWDAMKELDNPDFKNVDIVFSTPFLYYSQNPALSTEVNKNYKERYYSRPSDMVFKGFETTYHFTKLLSKYKDSLVTNLSDTSFTLFNSFKLTPVKLKPTNPAADFIENKKLYFIKKQAGTVKSVI